MRDGYGIVFLILGLVLPAGGEETSRLAGVYCTGCHSDSNKQGGLSLASFDPRHPEKNLETTEKVIRKLRAGMMPPPGSKRPDPSDAAAFVAALESTVDQAAAVHPKAGSRPFQRLNRAEYARAIRDLLGLEIDVAAYLPPDSVSNGFDNIADAQAFSATLLTGYLRAASQISRQALCDAGARKRLLACNARTEACAAKSIARLVDAAYRGTATAEDRADAMRFYRQGSGGGFEDGVRLALQSALMSPRFLFRLERVDDADDRVNGPALASRLSFFLWGAAPDRLLLQAAANGKLLDPASREREVRRMLADKRSEALSTRFASQWLRLQDLDQIVPDRLLFPNYDAALARSMRRETELFFDRIVREDRNLMDLFTSSDSFLDDRLARHYGLAVTTGAAFRKVAMPEERRGLLGQGSILASTSVADRTSAVLRGKWVMEVLFGTPPPPPPPNVPALDDSVKPTTREGVRLSTRQRIEQHRKSPACSGCHRYIDPLGLALENFDVTGAWRSADNGVQVDSRGDLYDGTTVQGPAGLREALLRHEDLVLRTFTENLLTYALGRRLEASDMTTVRAIVRRASHEKNRFSAFVLGVVESPAFLMNPSPKH